MSIDGIIHKHLHVFDYESIGMHICLFSTFNNFEQ